VGRISIEPHLLFTDEKLGLKSEGAAEGGFKGGIPPRQSVPPERLLAKASAQAGSGGGQFFSKWVRAKFRIEDTF